MNGRGLTSVVKACLLPADEVAALRLVDRRDQQTVFQVTLPCRHIRTSCS